MNKNLVYVKQKHIMSNIQHTPVKGVLIRSSFRSFENRSRLLEVAEGCWRGR